MAAIPTSVPFTYRDSLSMLAMIEALRDNLDTLQADFNTLAQNVNDAIDGNNQAITDALTQMTAQMQVLRQELINLIESSQQTGIAWSPVMGNQDAIGAIFGSLYDNVRSHALFWSDYDGMALEASTYDALGLSAREYDLKATAVDNLLLGDFSGRSQFPYGKSIPEGEPADIYLTETDARGMFVERNPTAANFENNGALA